MGGASLVLTLGACMSIPWDSPKVTPLGSFLALWSTAMSGLRPVLTALLLQNSKESGLSPVPLLWYDAAFSTVLLFLAFIISEETLLVSQFFKKDTAAGMGILIGGSTCAFAYNIVVFYLVKVTSSLTSVVLANLKTTLIIVVSVRLLVPVVHGKGGEECCCSHSACWSQGREKGDDAARRQLGRDPQRLFGRLFAMNLLGTCCVSES